MSDAEQKEVDWSGLPNEIFHVFENRTAQNSAAFLLPTLAEIQQRNPNLTLLDVGCGSASVTASFAKIIGPGGGRVTGVDINKMVLARGRHNLTHVYGLSEDEAKWVTLQEADGHELPFEDNTFDITYCHQVLAHNKGQPEILREMLRVTKPGGVVTAREGDTETESFWPALPGLLKFHQIVELRSMTNRGASTQSGRRLLSWALEANGGDRSKIDTSFDGWSYSEPYERKLWATGMITGALGIEKLMTGLREQNGATEEDIKEMRDAWIEWRDRDDATLSMLQGQIIMRK